MNAQIFFETLTKLYAKQHKAKVASLIIKERT